MTTRAEMHSLRDASRQTVVSLRALGADYIADRVERCAVARCHRVEGHRPWTCHSAGCPWCVRPLLARWLRTLLEVTGSGPGVSTIVVPVGANDADLRSAARTYRRALRDMRDRAARRRRAWRAVSVAGVLLPRAAGRTIVLCVRHDGLTRPEVGTLIRRRWSGAAISASLSVFPMSTVNPLLADRISLALARRGVEPLRIMVGPQGERSRRLRSRTYVEPMPILF